MDANQDGYTTSSSGDSGTITANRVSNAQFTNDKPGEEDPPDEPPEDPPEGPPDEPTPDEPDPPANPPSKPDDTPKTSDPSHTAMWAGLMALSMFGIGGTMLSVAVQDLRRSRKRAKRHRR